jgi:Type I phosphodiesterase / nucleotide pyrophosphatase
VDPSVTPAFAPFQTQSIAELIRREGMGEDGLPDLLFVNYNQINEVGHEWSMNSVQMAAAVRSSDRALDDLIELLDREVGRGEWVLALTADHGSTPDASVSGGFAIDQQELVRDLRTAFDRDGDDRSAIEGVRVTQLWVNRAELADGGFTAADVAWFLEWYTQGQNRSDPPALDAGEREVPVFAAAFPSNVLEGPLQCPGQ